MAPAKRKAGEAGTTSAPEAKRGRPKKASEQPEPEKKRGRPKKDVEKTASSTRPNRASLTDANKPKSSKTRNSISDASSPAKPTNASPAKKQPTVKSRGKQVKNGKNANEPSEQPNPTERRQSNLSVDLSVKQNGHLSAEEEEDGDTDGPSYWLMKAEPDSRIDKGKDVKFSIDDLKAAAAPEPWDGVRNLVARNNMRAMIKGDQAFFYHSNCKVPGIVGIMEVVQEHSVDESAFDAEHPYYDQKSTRDKPKWCVVHVEFRQKFPDIVKLKDLHTYAKDGGVLQNLQTLKQSRLSISKVSKREWDFIVNLANTEEQAEPQ